MAATTFMDPHDVPVITGTQGWERMYPYQYQFSKDDPERESFESSQIWYYDGLHYPEPHYPFDLIWDEAWSLALSQYNTRHFIIPPALGIDHRIVNGYVYITPVGIADQEVVAKRVPHFLERAGYYLTVNGTNSTKTGRRRSRRRSRRWTLSTSANCPKWKTTATYTQWVAEAEALTCSRVRRSDQYGSSHWHYILEFLPILVTGICDVSTTTTTQIFPGIPMSTLTKMVSGIDVVMYKPDSELIRLARLAIDTGLEEMFMKPLNAEGLMGELEKSAAGRDWLAEMEKARYPWFYISTGTGWYHHHISWNDNLDIPFDAIQDAYHEYSMEGKEVGRPTEKLV